MPTKDTLLELAARIGGCMRCNSPYEKETKERSPFLRDLYLEGPWFYPPRGSVKGFLGAARIMFVGEKPSTDKPFTRPPLKYLYRTLAKCGLEDAHLTDLVKCRGKVRVKTKEERAGREEEYKNCEGFLREEIRLINPRLIVAFGDRAFKQLKRLNLGIELKSVQHYSYRFLDEERFENDFKQIALAGHP